MEKNIELNTLPWTLSGTIPYAWRDAFSMELGAKFNPEIGPVPVSVPGSVQQALIDAGIIAHWKYGLNAKAAEWIEHRHWVYSCQIPASYFKENSNFTLHCEGLDYSGWIYFDSHCIGTFDNSFITHDFSISSDLFHETDKKDQFHELKIIFGSHPVWLGQLGYTSRIKQWKPRFNYTWDWIVRVVQTAVTGNIILKTEQQPSCEINTIETDWNVQQKGGSLLGTVTVHNMPISGHIKKEEPKQNAVLRCSIEDNGKTIHHSDIPINKEDEVLDFNLKEIPVEPWWPNSMGRQPIYSLVLEILVSEKEKMFTSVYEKSIPIGFKHIEWKQCEGSPKEADPWLCEVNGKKVFLQGINWTPISPTFADVKDDEVKKRVSLYREMGCNIVRVWGGAVLESETFYQACSEAGIMVWQELPLSSSGIDNWPPEDDTSITALETIAADYIQRRSHQVSLCMWSGGNELQGSLDGEKHGVGKPIDYTHPMMKRLKALFQEKDKQHRFIATSPMGPRFKGDPEENGLGLHWSVHGPWNVDGVLDEKWEHYWKHDDSLFRAETGCPGASSPETMKKYLNKYSLMPISLENPIWNRTSWWIEADVFKKEFGRDPKSAEEYADWSQERQASALSIAVKASKDRFPGIGGIIIWMGHDCFPCAANTSIIDVDGVPKKAYYAVKKLFTREN